MLIGTFNQDSARSWVFNSRYESIFIFSQNVLFHQISISKVSFNQLFDRVYRITSTGQNNSLHISSFSPPQSHNSHFGKHLQANWVNPFLINNHKGLIISLCYFIFELNDLFASFISKPPFTFGHFVPICCVGEEEG